MDSESMTFLKKAFRLKVGFDKMCPNHISFGNNLIIDLDFCDNGNGLCYMIHFLPATSLSIKANTPYLVKPNEKPQVKFDFYLASLAAIIYIRKHVNNIMIKDTAIRLECVTNEVFANFLIHKLGFQLINNADKYHVSILLSRFISNQMISILLNNIIELNNKCQIRI